jgi:mannan endo-1,4-beta-mannosidase
MKKVFYSKRVLIIITIVSLLFIACKTGIPQSENPIDPPPVVVPETPFKTLNYLYKISGKKTIAGIHNREPNSAPAKWTEEIKNTTGKYPGLWSGDFLFQQDNIDNRKIMIDEALKQWKKGSVVNIMWHACNPALSQPCGWDDGKGVLSSLSDAQWTELITDGTALNNRWKAMIDEVSVYLQFLKDNGVEVLWRPLHEMNQRKFWWGGRPGPNGTRKLYQIMHDYMKNTKGLSNLIWVWDMQDFGTLASDVNVYNPGKDYWDMVALDVYDGSGYTFNKYKIMVDVAGGKPIAIGECDKLPTAQQLLEQPKWTFFMGWSELVFEKNSTKEISDLINASNVLTLDKLPGW